MFRRSLFILMGLVPAAHAAPTQQQLCESALELASAKYAQCRLNVESKDSKAPDAATRAEALAKCSANLGSAFAKATDKYGLNCVATESSSAFDTYLTQCSDDAAAAAAGAALPDYAGDLATCTGDLAAATTDLATCTGDLAACAALPPARLLKTGQMTSYGAGTDGHLHLGVAQAYVDNGDGTITDTQTGLMWEKKSDDGTIHDKDNTYTWGSSTAPYTMNGTAVTTFLATLNAVAGGYAGHTDWRLPNRTELESILDHERHSPATSPAFNTGCAASCTVLTCSCTGVSSYYWSSSSYAGAPQGAWIVDFNGGVVGAFSKTGNDHVRAVRAGS